MLKMEAAGSSETLVNLYEAFFNSDPRHIEALKSLSVCGFLYVINVFGITDTE
jgi:hypothetical protein